MEGHQTLHPLFFSSLHLISSDIYDSLCSECDFVISVKCWIILLIIDQNSQKIVGKLRSIRSRVGQLAQNLTCFQWRQQHVSRDTHNCVFRFAVLFGRAQYIQRLKIIIATKQKKKELNSGLHFSFLFFAVFCLFLLLLLRWDSIAPSQFSQQKKSKASNEDRWNQISTNDGCLALARLTTSMQVVNSNYSRFLSHLQLFARRLRF